ncbi:MAG: tRNA pseudouridine(38-40) synthase TruA [Bordetella sp.]|nr:MAG: tRNA pseudouridine(38-40) synthase TruA [Bordetella sp.]
MFRIALGINYEGTNWKGWQKQPHGQTVQDVVETAIGNFLNKDRISVLCAGRTDSGVHAGIQVVHFDTELKRDEHSWIKGVNSFLPSSISVQWAKYVSIDFHARFSAISRTYMYLLYCGIDRPALWNNRVGWSINLPDIGKMKEAALILLGKHDFSSFRSSQCQAKHAIRILYQFDIEKSGPFLIFTLRANAFLHHMVRNLVGTLMYQGLREIKILNIKNILIARNRCFHNSPKISANGLYLTAIDYPKKFNLIELDSRKNLLSLIGI